MYEIIKILTTSLLSLITGGSLVYLKYYLDNKKKPGLQFDADLDRRNRVKEFLLDVLATMHPARVSCYLLMGSESGNLLPGDSMQRLKLYEEVTRDSKIAHLTKDFDGVLIEGPLHYWVDSMRQHKLRNPDEPEEYVAGSRDEVANKDFRAMMQHYNIHAQYARLLRNPATNAPIAIFAVSYDWEQNFELDYIYGLRQAGTRLKKILLATKV